MANRRAEDPVVLHREAQIRVLSDLAAGQDGVFELLGTLARYDVRHHFTPDVALLEVAASALGLACPPGSEPLEYDGLTDRYLPDQMLTGRTLRHRTQYAIQAAGCLRGGLLPDLLREAGGWEPGLWTYAVSAVVLYTRAAADRLGQTVPEIAVRIADLLGLELSADSQSID
jgi:hypothetical protein